MSFNQCWVNLLDASVFLISNVKNLIYLSIIFPSTERKNKNKQTKNNSYFLFYQVKNAPNLNYMEIIEELAWNKKINHQEITKSVLLY